MAGIGFSRTDSIMFNPFFWFDQFLRLLVDLGLVRLFVGRVGMGF